MPLEPRLLVEKLAAEIGLTTVRFTTVQPTPRIEAFRTYLAEKRHGEMAWMENAPLVRADPRVRMPEVESVAVFAISHHFERPPDPGGRTGMVARYGWGRDYHNLVGKRLKRLKKRLTAAGIDSWGHVDSVPVLERAWAEAAGMGFIGKNCVAILPAKTSWFLLAVLFIAAPIRPDEPLVKDHCGRCQRCLDACPTNAFIGPRALDARKCISYWTIEAEGLAPRELRKGFGRWILGCDVCQEVCPHNASPPDPEEDDLRPLHAWMDLDDILATPDEAFAERYAGTPLVRPKGVGLKRNALIALGNLGDSGAMPSIRLGLRHEHPVVRGAAVWACRQLGERPPSFDSDPLVRSEIEAE